MDGGFKAYVRLGDVRPSESNPRKDFGDIDALARSLEATGGEPVNPIVLVRDGNVYRIVDGERRYRALCKIHDEDERVGALVFNDYGDASSVVAMLATDDKRRLAPEEQAAGFQQMMVLGVDEDVAAKALGRDVDQVRRARRSLKAAATVEQASLDLDRLIVAGDDEFTEDERAQILAAGTGRSSWTPTDKAREIKRHHKAMAKLESLKRASIEYHDEMLADPTGYVVVGTCTNAKEADAIEAHGTGLFFAWWNHAYPAPSGWTVYRKRTAEEEEQATEKDAAEELARAERERQVGLCATMRYDMMEFVCDAMADDAPMAALPATCAKVMEGRRDFDADRYSVDVVCMSREGDLQACDPSPYEVVKWVDWRISNTNYWGGTPFNSYGLAKEYVAEVWDALVADGWKPSEGILEVREACGKGKE